MVLGRKRGLALALSGGSVRGIAHIGFLEVLEEHHIPVDHIVGTSMGALVGGCYASGKLGELKKKLLEISNHKIFSFLLERKLKKGKADGKTFEKLLREIVGSRRMNNLDIGFTAVATNLKSGEAVYLEKGELVKNILASISIPGIFPPVRKGRMFLVDGGVVDPLPREYAHKIANKVIAVNTMPSKFKYKEDGDVFDLISESVAILMKKLIWLGANDTRDELFIQVKTRHIESFDIVSIPKAIKAGRKAAKKNIRKIIKFSRS